MKISAFLLIVSLLLASASVYSQNTKLNLEMKSASFEEILDEIKDQSDFSFLYRSDIFNGMEQLDLKFIEVNLETILDKILVPAGFLYEIDDNVVVIRKTAPRDVIPVNETKALKTIKGKVTDENGNPMVRVSVYIKGTTVGTTTDVDGTFSLDFNNKNETIVFSFIGYESREIIIGEKSEINIEMKPSENSLDEIVVVGYGTTLKKDLTGSITTLVEAEIKKLPQITTFDQAIAGLSTGVFVAQNSGAPGAGATINIRGMSSIKGDNQPLYVIDGVPIVVNPKFSESSIGYSMERQNPLLAINPNDIQSIDILKDASAAAIYGARAANGVIIVTTKRGSKEQAIQVNLNYIHTIQNPIKTFDMLGVDEFKDLASGKAGILMELYRSRNYSDFIIEQYFPDVWNAINNPDAVFYNGNTDWQEEVLHRNAPTNKYGLTISGGTKNIAYSMALNATEQDGIIKNTGMDRYGVRVSLDSDVSKKLRVGANLSYDDSKVLNSTISLETVSGLRPDLPVYNEDGSWFENNLFGNTVFNPVYNLGFPRIGKSNNLMSSFYTDYKITNDLTFRSQLNYAILSNSNSKFTPKNSSDAVLQSMRNGVGTTSSLNTTDYESVNRTFDNTLNYIKKIGERHQFNALVGMSFSNMKIDMKKHQYFGFPDDKVLANLGSAMTVFSWDDQHTETGLNSYFGRINYIYDNRFLFTTTARSDVSSKFGPKNRRGFFPSAAFAWKIHNESFMKNLEFIDYLKLRVSAGRTGLDNLSDFLYLTYYNSSFSSNYENENGINPTDIPNPEIKWETTDQLDLGLEFGLFNNRIFSEIVYFTKYTNDILLFAPVIPESGSQNIFQNIADLSNKGWEIEIGGDVVRTKNFRWRSSFNISFIDNKIEKLNGGFENQRGLEHTGIIEGHPLGTSYGYVFDHIFQNQEEIDALNAIAPNGVYQDYNTAPGDLMYKDVNGDGFINELDETVIGSIQPDFFGGFLNSISYEGFELSVLFQFVNGVTKEWYKGRYQQFSGMMENQPKRYYDEIWSESNPNGNYPRIGGASLNAYKSSAFIVESSFIRLKSLNIAYNLPKELATKLFVKNIKVFANAGNLWTITKYPGLDPESVSRSVSGESINLINDTGSYPFSKTFSFGCNVEF